MTLTCSAGRLSIRCDGCGLAYRHTADERALVELLGQVTDEGWKKIRKAGDWTHQCPDCARSAEGRLL